MFSSFLAILQIGSMLSVAIVVFQMDLVFTHFNLGIVFLVAALGVTVSNLFVYCYFGMLASKSFEKMTNCLYESNWVWLPVGSKKYLILMISNAQIPLFYHGSGVMIMNLETFSKVFESYSLTDTISLQAFSIIVQYICLILHRSTKQLDVL